MEKDVFDGEEEKEDVSLEDEDSPEEDFDKGYLEDEKVEECAECGTAVKPEKKLAREVEGEEYVFCSKACADEFEESSA